MTAAQTVLEPEAPKPIPEGPPITIRMQGKLLARILRAMLLSSSRDAIRRHLYGIEVQADDKGVRLVATDGHQIAIYRVADVSEARGRSFVCRDDAEAIVAECARAGASMVVLDVGRATLAGARTLTWKPADVTFPNYKQVMPAKADKPARGHVDPERMARVCKTFDMMTEGRTRSCVARSSGDQPLDPIVFTSGYCPKLMMMLMPMRLDDPVTSLDAWIPA